MSAWASGNLAAKLKQQRSDARPAGAEGKTAPNAVPHRVKAHSTTAEKVSKAPHSAASSKPSAPVAAEAAHTVAQPASAPTAPAAAAHAAATVQFGFVSIPEPLAKYVCKDFVFAGQTAPAVPVAAAPTAAAETAAPPAEAIPSVPVEAPVEAPPAAPATVVAASSSPADIPQQPVPADSYQQAWQSPPSGAYQYQRQHQHQHQHQHQFQHQRYQGNPPAAAFVPQGAQQGYTPYQNPNAYRMNNNNPNYYGGPAFGEIPRQYAMRHQGGGYQQPPQSYPNNAYNPNFAPNYNANYGGDYGVNYNAGYQSNYRDPYQYSGMRGGRYNNMNNQRLQSMPPYYPPQDQQQQQQQQQQYQ